MQIVYLVEGETEKALLLALGVLGKIQIINLWQTPISKIERQFKPNTKIIVVFDTDVLDNLIRFSSNINHLIKTKRLHGLLQQTLNLEDELARALNCSKRKLFDHFNAVSDSEFKSKFIQNNQLNQKLNQLNIIHQQLWSQKLNDQLQHYASYQLSFDQLALR